MAKQAKKEKKALRGRAPPHPVNEPPPEFARAKPGRQERSGVQHQATRGQSPPHVHMVPSRYVHMVPIVDTAATMNNTLAMMGGDKDNSAPKRSTQYLRPYDGRHNQAASIEYDADWMPPESIRSKYGGKRVILGRCTGMVKAMKQRIIIMGKYHGNETEYTRAGLDIYLKMRVRRNEEAQYGVNMC